MKALVITKFGGPEALEIQEVPAPGTEEGKTLVRVEAGGLNFADVMTLQGGYAGIPKPPLVAGREFAGREEASSRHVMGYTQWGAFGEQAAVRPQLLWPVPDRWTSEQGAAFPVNFLTAYFAYWKAGLTEKSGGARVLIHAVAGGVGTAAVQIGKILGIEMYGTSSSDEKISRVRELGLQHAINYKQKNYEEAIKEMTNGEGVDAVLEMLGGEHTNRSIRCLREFGRVIVYGSATGEKGSVDPRLLYARGTSVHGLWLTQLSQNESVMAQAWKYLSEWLQQGRLEPVIDRVFPLDDAASAYRRLQEGKNFGKLVIKIS
jgi:NADPH2:quinone reductase